MILVTGATGRLGRLIAERLLDRIPAERLTATARHPSRATDLAARGLRVRHADYDDPESLRRAFAGIRQVLLVSSNAGAQGRDPLVQHRAAIEAAKDAGVARIVYTSHMGAGPDSAFPPMRDHDATEGMLAASGLAWTALRHGFYAGSAVDLMGDVAATGEVRAPRDGKVSWTAHADLAEAAAVLLAEEGRIDGPTPPLTGAEALDLDDLAALASDLLGRPVRRTVMADEDVRQAILARGAPERSADMALGLYRASWAGEFARVDGTLASLIGRPPVTMREVLAERIAR